jgi:hypothetical protein
MNGLLDEIMYCVVDWNGEIKMVIFCLPSGHNITVDFNGILNSLRLRCNFYRNALNNDCIHTDYPRDTASFELGKLSMFGPVDLDYRERLDSSPLLSGLKGRFNYYVNLLTYGDDNINSVSLEIDWFNQISVAEVFKVWGIGYTTATKETATLPFCDWQDVVFLKRKFRWNETLWRYTAPLDKLSMWKSLHCRLGTALDEPQHFAVTGSNVLYETALHGREDFIAMWELLMAVASEMEWLDWLHGGVFPDYDFYMSRHEKALGYFDVETDVSSFAFAA